MKNAMLFCIALLFSVSVNAATLNLSKVSSSGATQNLGFNDASLVSASGLVQANNQWNSLFDITTTADTPIKVEWKFNPTGALNSAILAFGLIDGPGGNYVGATQFFNIVGDFTFTALLTAGSFFAIDILNASSANLEYSLTVSAVPIPAALWLFAPALLGFFGLRRKAKKMEMAVA